MAARPGDDADADTAERHRLAGQAIGEVADEGLRGDQQVRRLAAADAFAQPRRGGVGDGDGLGGRRPEPGDRGFEAGLDGAGAEDAEFCQSGPGGKGRGEHEGEHSAHGAAPDGRRVSRFRVRPQGFGVAAGRGGAVTRIVRTNGPGRMWDRGWSSPDK